MVALSAMLRAMNGFQFDLVLLGPLVNRLVAELATPPGWWAAGVGIVCVALGFYASERLHRLLEERGRGRLAFAWADRVAWPLTALLLLLVARAVLGQFVPVIVDVPFSGFRLKDARASYGFGLQSFLLGFPMHFDWSWKTHLNKDYEDLIYFFSGGSETFRKAKFSFWIGYDF